MALAARILAAACAVSLASPAAAGAAARGSAPHARPSWQLELEAPVRWQRITHLGQLLVQTETALHGVDPAIGKIAWTRPVLAGLDPEACTELPRTPLLVCGEPRTAAPVVILDALSGTIVFDSRRDRSATLLGYWPLTSVDGLLVLTSGKAGHATLALHELARAEVRWRLPVPEPPANAALPEPLELTDSVLYATPVELMRIDSSLGTIVWRRPSGPADGGRFLARGKDDPVVLWVAEHEKGRRAGISRCAAYDVATGEPAWAKASRIPGPLGNAFPTERGWIVESRGEPARVHLIDLATGRSLWGENGEGVVVDGALEDYELSPAGAVLTTAVREADRYGYRLKVLDPATGAARSESYVALHGRTAVKAGATEAMSLMAASGVVQGSLVAPAPGGGWYAFDPDGGALYRIEPRSAPARISRERVTLAGGDLDRWIEPFDEGVLVRTPLEIVSFGRSGNLRYQVHYPPVEEPAAYATLEEARRARAVLGTPAGNADVEPSRTAPLRYRHLLASRERAASAESPTAYLLVRLAPKRVALARVNKETGEILDRVDLEARSWQLDLVDQRVFRVDGLRRIVAFGS